MSVLLIRPHVHMLVYLYVQRGICVLLLINDDTQPMRIKREMNMYNVRDRGEHTCE